MQRWFVMMVLVGQVVVAGHVDATGIRQDARSLVARDNALLLASKCVVLDLFFFKFLFVINCRLVRR